MAKQRCKGCNKWFNQTNRNQRYCDRGCSNLARQRAYRGRVKQLMAAARSASVGVGR